jgi:hypothetical protein
MSCFKWCFWRGDHKTRDDSSNFSNHIVKRKNTENRIRTKANEVFFKGGSVVVNNNTKTHKEPHEKDIIQSNLTTTNNYMDNNTAKPLKKIFTAITKTTITNISDSKVSDGDITIAPFKRKSKTYWEAKDKLHCYFCGGAACKHENWQNHEGTPAIIGLHSDFITEDVIASQRPSTILINQYNLIGAFKKNNIGLIVNVQREGEHPFCGPNKKLEESSGFAYDPHTFISEDIKVRRTGWKDMSIPDSINFMLDIVKEMAVTINENKSKVLVHCHAGFGRTGVVIACYYIYVTNKSVHEVIDYIRSKRPGSIQKDSQYNFCIKFKNYINKCRLIFGDKNPVEYYMKNQNELLFGEDLKRHEFIPKLISIIFEKIEDNLNKEKITKEQIYQYMFYPEEWTEDEESRLVYLKQQINLGRWNALNEKEIEVKVLTQLLYDWLEDCVTHVISPDKIYFIFQEKGLSFLIEKNIKDSQEFTKSSRKSLCDNIKICLRTIESETLCCIANFLNRIKPGKGSKTSDRDSFMQVTKRLCVALLGFDTKNSTNNNENEKIIDYALRLFNLLAFFGIVLEKDIEDEIIVTKKNCFSPYVNRRKMQEVSLPEFKLINTDTGAVCLQNTNNNIKININNSYNVTGSPSLKNKYDHKMFEAYRLLDIYFGNEKEKFEEMNNLEETLNNLGQTGTVTASRTGTEGENNFVLDRLKSILKTQTPKLSKRVIATPEKCAEITRRTKRGVTLGSIKEQLLKFGNNKVTGINLVKLNLIKKDESDLFNEENVLKRSTFTSKTDNDSPIKNSVILSQESENSVETKPHIVKVTTERPSLKGILKRPSDNHNKVTMKHKVSMTQLREMDNLSVNKKHNSMLDSSSAKVSSDSD